MTHAWVWNWLWHSPWPWESCLTPLCPSFSIFKMGILYLNTQKSEQNNFLLLGLFMLSLKSLRNPLLPSTNQCKIPKGRQLGKNMCHEMITMLPKIMEKWLQMKFLFAFMIWDNGRMIFFLRCVAIAPIIQYVYKSLVKLVETSDSWAYSSPPHLWCWFQEF